jgi:thiol-disulfide isomerase/thioredoxin
VQTETDERHHQPLEKPRRRLSIWIPTIFLVLFVGGSIFMGMRARPDNRPGVEFSPPPAAQSSEIVFKGFGAQKDRTLSEFEGKPLVVNYFASWCSPCRKEMKALQTAHAAYRGEVAFLGVNFRDIEDDAVELIRTARVTYAIASDFEGVTMRQLLDRSQKKARFLLPITFFVDEGGRVVDVVSGALDDDELRHRIKTSFRLTQ